jgi:hypothetical protein
MKKISWPTTSNYIKVTRNLYCAPGVQFSNLEDETFFIGKNYVFK